MLFELSQEDLNVIRKALNDAKVNADRRFAEAFHYDIGLRDAVQAHIKVEKARMDVALERLMERVQ